MRQAQLEQAISQLVRLLQDGESDEAKYQEYFEKNPVVFEALGYSAACPKPRFPLPDGEHLEPDFLVRRPDGLYEIFELKTPQERLVHGKKHRNKLYARVDEYVSQVETYSEYFDDSKHRAFVREQFSLDVQKKPDMVLVVGVDSGVDKKLLHLLIRRRTAALRIVTYDDIVSLLQFQHAALFGHAENLSGASWHAIVTLHDVDVGRRQYIFDAGDSLSRNRWSIYLDEHKRLCFEILDRDGATYSVSVRPGTEGFEFGARLYICCEFGSSESFSVMQILIDNRIATKREFSSSVSVSAGLDFSRSTIAADIEGKNHGTFDMAGLAIYQNVLTFRQRQARAEAIFQEFFDPAFEDAGSAGQGRRPVLPNTGAYLVISESRKLE